MTDIEKPEYAGIFPDQLANGINPLDNTPAAENELVNHVRISRCFFYVSDVLRQVIEERSAPKSKAQKRPFSVTREQPTSSLGSMPRPEAVFGASIP